MKYSRSGIISCFASLKSSFFDGVALETVLVELGACEKDINVDSSCIGTSVRCCYHWS